jgi:hypothetical protein
MRFGNSRDACRRILKGRKDGYPNSYNEKDEVNFKPTRRIKSGGNRVGREARSTVDGLSRPALAQL